MSAPPARTSNPSGAEPKPPIGDSDAGPDVGTLQQTRTAVEEKIDENPWVEHLARVGWAAKAVVYGLMGIITISVGRDRSTVDDASPEGALNKLGRSQFGHVLLSVLVVGLALYVVWRLFTSILVRGNDPKAHLTRIGYLASAGFYVLLAASTIGALRSGDTPEDSNTIERLSRSLLESGAGRIVLLLGGLVMAAVGVVFIVDKGLRRSFEDDMHLERAAQTEARLVRICGVVGWIGRGLVTFLVGWFVVRAAWTADSSEARGFDRALRELATTDVGGPLVIASGMALLVYALYCLVSLRHRELEG